MSFTFGSRFVGMEEKIIKLRERRQLVQKEEHQPEFVALQSFIGTAPGVK